MKKMISVFLSVALLLGVLVVPAAAANDPVATRPGTVVMPTDIDSANERYRDAIRELAGYSAFTGLLDSSNKLKPNQNASKSDFGKIATNLFGSNIRNHTEWSGTATVTQSWVTSQLTALAEELGSGCEWNGGEGSSSVNRGQMVYYFSLMLATADVYEKLVHNGDTEDSTSTDPVAAGRPVVPVDVDEAYETYRAPIRSIAGYHGLVGLLDSNNKLYPNQNATKADFGKVARNLFGSNLGTHSDWTGSSTVTQSWVTSQLSALAEELGSGCTWNGGDSNGTVGRGQMIYYFSMTIEAASLYEKLTHRVDESVDYSRFIDVPPDAYYTAAVTWGVRNRYVSGTDSTHFSPNSQCTIAQTLTFLYRAEGSPTVSTTYPLLATDHWAQRPMAWALSKGLIDEVTAVAELPCSRAQLVIYLWKLAGQPTATSDISYTDVSSTASYYQAVRWCTQRGLVNGTSSTTFSPNDTCTRAQIITILYRGYADR